MSYAYSVGNIQPRLRDIRGTTGAEQTVECIPVIGCMTITDQDARNMRSSQRAASCLCENIGHVNIYTNSRQSFDDCLPTLNTFVLEGFETGPYRTGVTDVKCEEMNFEVAVVRTELAPAHNSYTKSSTSGDSLVVPRDRIMIRYRDSLKVRSLRSFDQFARRHRSV
jgi:hypothetical protein